MVELLLFVIVSAVGIGIFARLLSQQETQREAYQADWDYAEHLAARSTVTCECCKKQTQDYVQIQHAKGQWVPMCRDCQELSGLHILEKRGRYYDVSTS